MRQRGVTLVELIISMVVAGVIISGIWSVWATLGKRSADPLVARQTLAVAQSLLREIELQPLPGTAVAASAPGRIGYASILDYNGLNLSGIQDAEGVVIPGLEAYTASISVTAQALSGIPANQGWWIQVTVSGPDGKSQSLGSWRARR
ncbi:MAG: type II secretion system protein [Rubrivivax sp.]|jgi:MSHA pilin protein MshD|nr:prepilin-type N-terminal cleavage/methylation domain-containing protein [Rubrivivax sp.]